MSITLTVPELSLVVLVGASGSGKSTFARKHFLPTEVISSDACRALVSDDENDQTATPAAFEIVHTIAEKRLARGKLTVIDATNVRADSRKSLVDLARKFHCLPVAIVFDLPAKLCDLRNRDRADRSVGFHTVREQSARLRDSLRGLSREGFRYIHTLRSVEDVDSALIERQPLWTNKKSERGPFDMIGDVHGCFDELCSLLNKLGYVPSTTHPFGYEHPQQRKVVFLGDLVDRGPKIVEVLRLVMAMTASGHALCVPGNHDVKLLRKLNGKNVSITHGLQQTLNQLESVSPEEQAKIARFLDSLVSHYVLDGGRLVVAHAGVKEELQGRGSQAVREFCLYGETTGEVDEYGLPIRADWAAHYRGSATVVYGHTPVPTAEWFNRTICIDTGCVFGGSLTALRYPEQEIVSVEAAQVYFEPIRPLASPREVLETRPEALLDIEDVSGKRVIRTNLIGAITIREQNAMPALESICRFAIDPRWLIYLPPTMSPSETCTQGPYLEHPRETFAYFRQQGVERVICEKKHMGSRAVIVACRDDQTAKTRFAVTDGSRGVCYSRTGRPFFSNESLEQGVLDRVVRAMDQSGLWAELDSSWVCLDAEIMPWSAKAQELLQQQYAAVAASGLSALSSVARSLAQSTDAGAAQLLERIRQRETDVHAFQAAYRQYCWQVNSLADYRIAPFHLLASDKSVHSDKPHTWHMDKLARLADADPDFFVATPNKLVTLASPEDEHAATQWWEALTDAGSEGMVVKPLDWVTRSPKGLVQPALKCRGREYLRIIYGPEYTQPEHLERLRKRGLGTKRALALREYALGLEGLDRFVRREPLYRVHECAFGVLAMESEPVDPRL